MKRLLALTVAVAVVLTASTAYGQIFASRSVTRTRIVNRPLVVRQQAVVVQPQAVFVQPHFVQPQAFFVPQTGCHVFGSSAFFFGH